MSALRFLFVVLVANVVVAAGAPAVHAQPDSVRAEILKEKGFPPNHSPRRALWRGAAVPGWGQVYNRQYYKLPFVYAGLAGLGFLLKQSMSRVTLFRRANLFVIGRERAGEDGTNEYEQFADEFNRATAFFAGEPSGDQLRSQRDRFRRRRNLSLVGIGVFYALTLVDAYVSAHLLTFDIDDDLAVNVHPVGPAMLPNPPTPGSDGDLSNSLSSGRMGVRVRVRF